MEYITEYKFFSFFKKKKDNNNIERKECVKKFNNKDGSVSKTSDKILYFSSRNYKTVEDCVINESPIKQYLVINTTNNYLSLWRYSPTVINYSHVEYDISDLIELNNENGIVINSNVKILNSSIVAKITNIWTGIFTNYDTNADIRESRISTVLELKDSDNNIHYRIPSMVETLDSKEYILPNTLIDDINDYMYDIVDNGDFEVRVSKGRIDKNEVYMFLDIKIKEKNNIEIVGSFFRNIDTLKKRLKSINNCDIDVEEITKTSIKIKIYKSI